jgi:hypothetical protein
MPDENTTINFNLTINEVDLLLAALGEMPAKMSFELIFKLRSTAQIQLAEANKPAPDPAPIVAPQQAVPAQQTSEFVNTQPAVTATPTPAETPAA